VTVQKEEWVAKGSWRESLSRILLFKQRVVPLIYPWPLHKVAPRTHSQKKQKCELRSATVFSPSSLDRIADAAHMATPATVLAVVRAAAPAFRCVDGGARKNGVQAPANTTLQRLLHNTCPSTREPLIPPSFTTRAEAPRMLSCTQSMQR